MLVIHANTPHSRPPYNDDASHYVADDARAAVDISFHCERLRRRRYADTAQDVSFILRCFSPFHCRGRHYNIYEISFAAIIA